MLMVHNFLHTSPHKVSIFETSVRCSIFPELDSHIDMNSGQKVLVYVSRQNSK